MPKKWRGVVKNAGIITEVHKLCTREPEKFKAFGYRYRVKVECLFSAVKERYNAFVRTEKGAGPANEIALKFLAHNIHVLMLAAGCYGLDVYGIFERDEDQAA